MTIVILAAGAARRMGRQKLLLHVDGRPMIESVIAAAAGWPIVVVAGDEVASTLGATAVRVVRNGKPERGMTHSLALANAAIPAGEAIAVLLGDVPDITQQAIAAAVDAYDDTIDVVVPTSGERLVHPVVFGPQARRMIPALPDGDTIKRLRDDPTLRRRIVESDTSALLDIDTPADYMKRSGRSMDVERNA